jgi:hypothetical protein
MLLVMLLTWGALRSAVAGGFRPLRRATVRPYLTIAEPADEAEHRDRPAPMLSGALTRTAAVAFTTRSVASPAGLHQPPHRARRFRRQKIPPVSEDAPTAS